MNINIKSIENNLIKLVESKGKSYMQGETTVNYIITNGHFEFEGKVDIDRNIDNMSMYNIKELINKEIKDMILGGNKFAL